jgi:GntR family transcriptional regulator
MAMDSAVATALNLDLGSPVFPIERPSYSIGHRPVDYEKLPYRGGDQIRFVTRLVRRLPGARKGGSRK